MIELHTKVYNLAIQSLDRHAAILLGLATEQGYITLENYGAVLEHAKAEAAKGWGNAAAAAIAIQAIEET